MEKSERVFNASSTLTPDSMMSDESQSRDCILPETSVGCTGGPSNIADVPQTALQSDVRQFSSISAETGESCVPDNSTDKCERSDITESPEVHNRCMLSGIDVSSLNFDASISLDSADVSAVAELNDARLSIADGDSSLNSTLKGSDNDELSSGHGDVEISTSQPTFSVSIPISTMFEMATDNNRNADVPNRDVKSSSSRCNSRAMMPEYSPISDADEEAPVCQSPLHEPSTPSVNKRSITIPFSPISPFTPRPSSPSTPLPVVPLSWSCDMPSSTACDASLWNTSATNCMSETADTGKTGRRYLDKFMSAAAAAVSPSSYFTFTQCSSYSQQSALGHEKNLIAPMQVNAPAGYCQDASFEQQQQQHTSSYHYRVYQQPEIRHPSMISPEHRCLSRLSPTCMRFSNSNTVGGSMSMHSLYTAGSGTQMSNIVEAGKCYASMPTTTVGLDSKTESRGFIMSPDCEARLVQEAKEAATSHATVSNFDHFDSSQTCHNAAAGANFHKSNNG